MYQAPLVAGFICCVPLGFEWVAKEWNLKIHPALQWYTWFYLGMLYLAITAISGAYTEVLSPTSWLDAEEVKNYVYKYTLKAKTDEADWNANALKAVQNSGLQIWCMLCPLWVICTWCICVYHTYEHVMQIPACWNRSLKFDDERRTPWYHGKVMIILSLPTVYGLMAFKSVTRMWEVCINHVIVSESHTHATIFSSYLERKEFLQEMFHANFMVGDVMEAIALMTFGHLVMEVLHDAKNQEAEDNMRSSTASARQLGHSGSTMSAIGHLHSHLNRSQARSMQALKDLTISGIKLFALACVLQAVYQLLITTMAFNFPEVMPSVFSFSEPKGKLQTEDQKLYMETWFSGAGFFASFAAIGNVMIIEHGFEEQLHEFSPFLKFWGTKILVSLSYMQLIIFNFFGLTDIETNLMFASTICFECMLIAAFHFIGWKAESAWYGKIEAKDLLKSPLLES